MTKLEIEAEVEVKEAAKQYFKANHSDKFGYVSEKCARIDALGEDSAWVAFQMLHVLVRRMLLQKLSNKAKRYLVKHEIYTAQEI